MDPALLDMRRRFWVSAALALPVLLLAMVADLAPGWLPVGRSMRTVQWLELVLATPVVLWGGWPLLVRGWRSVVTWNLNRFARIGLGVSVAWGYSLVALLAPQLFPPGLRLADGSVPVYFEAAAVITALVLLGQVLELRARGSTNAAIRLLLGLAPTSARRVRDDGSEDADRRQPGRVAQAARLPNAGVPPASPGAGQRAGLPTVVVDKPVCSSVRDALSHCLACPCLRLADYWPIHKLLFLLACRDGCEG